MLSENIFTRLRNSIGARQSVGWFRRQVSKLSNVTPARLLADSTSKVTRVEQFGMYMFYYDPKREEEIIAVRALTQSFSLIKGEKHFESVEVETKNIQTNLQELKRNSVDIIKADIEGLWEEFGNELLDNKIDFKYLATELELNFDRDIATALDRATKMCNKFRDNNYVVVINRRREKLMLELLFIRKDIYAS